ncbi:MAG: hypothetical protein H8E15_11865 [Planctomycetes bacterium]|nr:hypothetical protein [Planctomycetota bacterium]
MSHTLVGILARVDEEANPGLRTELDGMSGVSTFEVGEEGKLGILLRAESTDQAHHRLRHDIEGANGILAAWPVYTHFGEEFAV